MAVKYQKARFLIAGSLAAAVIGGTAYFAQPVATAPLAADAAPVTASADAAAGGSQAVSAQVVAPAQTTNRVTTTTKAKKTRGS